MVGETIWDAISWLSRSRAQIVKLFYFGPDALEQEKYDPRLNVSGMSVKEISKHLGKSVTTVTSTLHFARQLLKKNLPHSITETRGW